MTAALSAMRLASVLFLALLLAAPAGISQVECEGQRGWTMSVEVIVFSDGWADVSLVVDLSGDEAFVVLPVLGDPELLLVTDGNGLPLNFTLEGDALAVETLGAREVIASYQTQSLTSRESGVWEVSIDLEQADEVTVKIPRDAAIVGLSSALKDVVLGADWVTLTFDGGSAWVAYVLEAPGATAQKAQETGLTTPPEAGTGLSERGPSGLSLPWVAAGLGALVLVIATALAFSRR